ncbi:PIN domain-containing protein [Chelativorans sp. ZYF759]|uniref:type II toxin-antitoxin system VapC family toxin n=1 Tax=Chelativorans sp. ZYF759 TaxID=2692213 RepID=UPI00145E1E7C|nr:PIN domain-containing protein [Chelativorans sp. ZYF759]
MTSYLVDTHILLWAMDDSTSLSEKHRRIINAAPLLLVSMASMWEIAIKQSLNKLAVPEGLASGVLRAGFDFLDIRLAHIEALRTLPQHHGDPFDRMLIAQARVEGLTVLTADRRFSDYGLELA